MTTSAPSAEGSSRTSRSWMCFVHAYASRLKGSGSSGVDSSTSEPGRTWFRPYTEKVLTCTKRPVQEIRLRTSSTFSVARTVASNICRQPPTMPAARWNTASDLARWSASAEDGCRRSVRTSATSSWARAAGSGSRPYDGRDPETATPQLGHQVLAEEPARSGDERVHSWFSAAKSSRTTALTLSISEMGIGDGPPVATAS